MKRPFAAIPASALLACAAAPVLSGAPQPQEAPTPGGRARPHVELAAGLELDVSQLLQSVSGLSLFRTLQDDQVLAEMNVEGAQPSIDERRVRFHDVFVAWDPVDSGDPGAAGSRVVRRRFEQLMQRVQAGELQDHQGLLAGRTIVLTAGTAGDARPQVRLEPAPSSEEGKADGEGTLSEGADAQEALPSSALEGHRMPYPALALLPAGEVEPGDSWEIPASTALELLGLLEGPRYFGAPQGGAQAFEDALRASARCTGRVRYEGIEPSPPAMGGTRCWVLSYELAIEADIESFDPSEMGVPMPKGAVGSAMHTEGKGTGRMWIDCERALPVARTFSLEAKLAMGYARGTLHTEVGLYVRHGQEQRWEAP